MQDGCGTVQSLHAKYSASVSKPQSSEPTTNAQVSKPNIKTASETPRDDLEVSNHNKAVSSVPLTSTPDIQNSKFKDNPIKFYVFALTCQQVQKWIIQNWH